VAGSVIFEEDWCRADFSIYRQEVMDGGRDRFASVFEISQFTAEVMLTKTTENHLARLGSSNVFDGGEDLVHVTMAFGVGEGYGTR